VDCSEIDACKIDDKSCLKVAGNDCEKPAKDGSCANNG
jgi:hypothetical protein